MSSHVAHSPECLDCASSDIDLMLTGRPRDLGAFEVRRVLPSARRRLVGPFIFFDEMGPATLEPGEAMDVRPHPHINLATVTYLYDGEIHHRDSLGNTQLIQPGAINWMTAGRGITHSERSPEGSRNTARKLHGLQLWVALPKEHEETLPSFVHYPSETLPKVELDNVSLRVLAGDCYGARSPVETLSRLFYVDAQLEKGATLPIPESYVERACYVVSGQLKCGTETLSPGTMAVFSSSSRAVLEARGPARVALLGGAPFMERRHIWWNFVSTRSERIEQAKDDWKNNRFAKVPGDEDEFIPLPED